MIDNQLTYLEDQLSKPHAAFHAVHSNVHVKKKKKKKKVHSNVLACWSLPSNHLQVSWFDGFVPQQKIPLYYIYLHVFECLNFRLIILIYYFMC